MKEQKIAEEAADGIFAKPDLQHLIKSGMTKREFRSIAAPIIQSAIEKATEELEWMLKDTERQRDNFKRYAEKFQSIAHASEQGAALERIKTLVCGDKRPNWQDDWCVTQTRTVIADICDSVLSQRPAPATASDCLCPDAAGDHYSCQCPIHGSDVHSAPATASELEIVRAYDGLGKPIGHTVRNPDSASTDELRKLAEETEKALEYYPRKENRVFIILSALKQAAASTPSGGTASTGKCPFCGGEGVLLSTHDIPRNQYLWVQCNDCGAQGPRFKCYGEDALGRDKAWETWKRRVASTPSGGEKENSAVAQAVMIQGLLGFDASTKPEQVVARVKELLQSPSGGNEYPTVVESVRLLEEAGMGAVGKPNTLLAMVKEIISKITPSGGGQEKWTRKIVHDEIFKAVGADLLNDVCDAIADAHNAELQTYNDGWNRILKAQEARHKEELATLQPQDDTKRLVEAVKRAIPRLPKPSTPPCEMNE